MTLLISIILISLIFSAFFSGMEIAYVTANRLQIELEKKQGRFSSKIISKLTEKPDKFIATMLVGNNIALVVYGIYMSKLLLFLVFPNHAKDSQISGWILLTQTLISTLIILVTAEFLPKAIFRIYANKLLTFFSILLWVGFYAFYPVSEFMVFISNMMIRLAGQSTKEQKEVFNRVDLEHYILEKMEEVENKNEVDNEIEIFQNALEFGDLKARDCMVHRKSIVGICETTSKEEAIELFTKTGLSKIMIYKDDIDQIIGYVHSFGLFEKPRELKDIILPVEFVVETKSAQQVLNLLIKKRRSVAIVLDEYGGTAGMITTEDVIEELFGEINDEHDKNSLKEIMVSKREFIFSARLEVDYINKQYKLNLPQSETYETLGGLIIQQTEEIPEKGHVLRIDNYSIEITQATNNYIDEIRIKQLLEN